MVRTLLKSKIHRAAVTHCERFVTYAIRGESGSGIISLSGSAARRDAVVDLMIIAAFAHVHEVGLAKHKPELVFVDDRNKLTKLPHQVPTQRP